MHLQRIAIAIAGITVLGACGKFESPTTPANAAADAVQTQGVRRRVALTPVDPVPQCSSPAPLYRFNNPAPDYLFVYKDGVDGPSTTAALAAKYGLHIKNILVGAPNLGFIAMTDAATLASLRCEPPMLAIYQDRTD